MSRSRPTTAPRSGGGSRPIGAVAQCPATRDSEILLVDEIGLPLASTKVTVRANGSTFSATTDADGRLCFNLPPGTAVQIEIPNLHETQAGDSMSTASGRHFAAGGIGP